MKIKVGDGYAFNSQLIVSIGKRRFSIVDLVKPPIAMIPENSTARRMYESAPVEVARVDTKITNVIGRFPDFPEAIKYLEENASDIWTQKK